MKNTLNMKPRLNMTPRIAGHQKGVVLLEALIAIVIFAFGILALLGLQSVMMKENVEARNRAEAAYVVQQEISTMQTYPVGLGGNYTKAIQALPNGQLSVTPLTGGRLNLMVTWQTGSQPQHNFETTTSIFTVR
jgi:type IV pilus assembly protein PilV